MPRVKPRTSVYGVLPILACIILVGAIVFTFILGIKPYQREYAPRVGPAPIRQFPEPDVGKVAVDERIPGLTEEGKKEETKEATDEVAPGEGKEEAPPGKAAEGETETKEAPKADAKAPADE